MMHFWFGKMLIPVDGTCMKLCKHLSSRPVPCNHKFSHVQCTVQIITDVHTEALIQINTACSIILQLINEQMSFQYRVQEQCTIIYVLPSNVTHHNEWVPSHCNFYFSCWTQSG